MIKIALVDDDKLLHKEMEEHFSRFQIAYDFDFNVDFFSVMRRKYTISW